MDTLINQFFFPVSFAELYTVWNRYPDAVPYAGGTHIISRQKKNMLEFPPTVICLDKIPELHRITRTEHYLEIGAMVNLNKILWLSKIIPEAICKCLENIGGVQLRNIATIGGNICCNARLLDLSAPLSALDAQYEIRGVNNSRWVAAARFHSVHDKNVMEKQELLTRIRLPLHQWDYSIYKKFYNEDTFHSQSLVFLARTQKNLLTDVRVIYKGSSILRNRNAESILTGKILPINHKIANDFIESWKEFLAPIKDVDKFSKYKITNYLNSNIENLTE